MSNSISISDTPTLTDQYDTAQNNLTKLEKSSFDRLDFIWEGIRFGANSNPTGDGSAVIQLNARLGHLFYSVEDRQQRVSALDCIRKTNRGIDGCYQLQKNGEVSFESVTATDMQMKGADLMGAVTLILLEAETHLRTLRSHLKPIH